MLSSPRGNNVQDVAAANKEYVGDGAFHGLRRTESGPGLPRSEGRFEGYTWLPCAVLRVATIGWCANFTKLASFLNGESFGEGVGCRHQTLSGGAVLRPS